MLDVVLVHYQQERLHELQDFWPRFLEDEKVAALRPRVFIYCHMPQALDPDALQPLFKHGGEVVAQENFGREVSGYLEHIVRHWHDLADHKLFSQDLPEPSLMPRFLRMFNATTGFLPLAVYGVVSCDDSRMPLVAQVHAMFTHKFCPPEGYSAGFNGEFVVSRRRIVRNARSTYSYLLDMAAAQDDHWIHRRPDGLVESVPWADGDRSNPMFAHLMERAWSLAFDCHDWALLQDWWRCNDPDCDLACQCFDT